MFRDIDKNGDGQITKEEFLSEMMKTERKWVKWLKKLPKRIQTL